MHELVPATDSKKWRALLAEAGPVDACYLPEYHLAYSLRIKNSVPWLWQYRAAGGLLLYPFLLTPIDFAGITDDLKGFYDISSIYGYTGPVATSTESDFLAQAWKEFDALAAEKKVIAEFIRFSPFNSTERFAHPSCKVEANRSLAVSRLPESDELLLEELGSKTRNMLRKAEREGLRAREMKLPEDLAAFRELYNLSMDRNQAREFFRYDDAYYAELLKLGAEGLRLFGTFSVERLVAAAMAVVHGPSALYHLGAGLPDFARLGAGNLALYEMSRILLSQGVCFINLTGGRTTAEDDPLLRFKRSNATGAAVFYIGKRILNHATYDRLGVCWQNTRGTAAERERLIFWRA